jgi:hypothetical protein
VASVDCRDCLAAYHDRRRGWQVSSTSSSAGKQQQCDNGLELHEILRSKKEGVVLDWISETILAIVTYLPALMVAEDSPNFMLTRVMLGLLLIVLVVYVIALVPFRPVVTHWIRTMSNLFVRRL